MTSFSPRRLFSLTLGLALLAGSTAAVASTPQGAPHELNVLAPAVTRIGPGLGYSQAGKLAAGPSAQAICQTTASKLVQKASTWYGLTDGSYVSGRDAELGTSAVQKLASPLAVCDPTQWSAHYTAATAKDSVRTNTGPGVTYAEHGKVAKGSALELLCRTDSGSEVNGSHTWYRVGAGDYIAQASVTLTAGRQPPACDPASIPPAPPAKTRAPALERLLPRSPGAAGPEKETPAAGAGAPAALTNSSINITAKVDTTGVHYANWVPGDTTIPNGSLSSPVPMDPGDDYNGTNDWVRTLDITTILVTYEVSPDPATGTGSIEITGSISGGPVFFDPVQPVTSGIGGSCTGPNGFGLLPTSTQATSFSCDIAAIAPGASVSKTFELEVIAPMSTPHLSSFTVDATISESGVPRGSGQTVPTYVSAGPRFELIKRGVGALGGTVSGPPGSANPVPGVVQRWAIGVASLSSDPYGLSMLPGPLALNDLVGTTPAQDVWLHSCIKVAGYNLSSWPQQVASSPSASQLLAPTPACTQSPQPNGPISISLAGIDYSRLTTPPSQGLLGYFELQTWVSVADIDEAGGTLAVCNSVEVPTAGQLVNNVWTPGTGVVGTWHPVDVSNHPNLLGGAEPIDNNGACLAATKPVPQASESRWYKAAQAPFDGTGVAQSATPQSRIGYYNTGPATLPAGGGYICDKWDDSRFEPGPLPAPSLSIPWATNVKVEWGTGNWGSQSTAGDQTKWKEQATNDCSDNAMFTSSTTVALSSLKGTTAPAGVNVVRFTFVDSLPGSQFIQILLEWNIKSTVTPGEELRNYAAAYMPDRSLYQSSNCSQNSVGVCRTGLIKGESAGPNSHWWTVISGSVNVVKSRPSPSDTFAFAPGGTMTWQVDATGVAPAVGAVGSTKAVTIVDTLPPGFTYLPGTSTGLPEPVCTSAVSPQVCTWTVGNLPWGTTVTFSFQTSISLFEPPATYTNTARGETPDDPTPYDFPDPDPRIDTETVDVIRASGASIDKVASPAAPGPGDTVTYTLHYANLSSADLATMDAVDLLPFNGDPRGSVIGSGALTLTGVNPSSKVPPEEIWVSDSAPAALDALDGVDGYVDTKAAGIFAVGLAQWPCTVSGSTLTAAGGGPCPFSIGQVTALRFIGTGSIQKPFLPVGSGPHAMTLTYKLGQCITGNRFANSWLARFGDLLPIRYPAQTAATSGCADEPDPDPIVSPTPIGSPPGGTVTRPPGGTVKPSPSGSVTPKPSPPALPIRDLPRTGSDAGSLALLAALSLGLGWMLLIAGRKRGQRISR